MNKKEVNHIIQKIDDEFQILHKRMSRFEKDYLTFSKYIVSTKKDIYTLLTVTLLSSAVLMVLLVCLTFLVYRLSNP